MRVQPERLGDDLLELQLDLEHVLARRKAGSIADPENVRVDREGLFVEGRVEDYVGGLPADAG